MNKQVAAFLFYFLKDVALPEKFLRSLLKKTFDATLVAEIDDCDWDKDTQTITTPCKKNQDHDLKELKTTTWYKNAFDLKGLGKAA